MKNRLLKVAAVTAAAFGAGASMAAGPDLSGMTAQIDWTTTIAAVLLVAGGICGVYVVLTATNIVGNKVKRG